MGENTKIEWAHHTFNPWMGCTKVSAGCKNCYAENCLFAARGKPKRASAAVSQMIVAQVRQHSQKPDEARDRLVQLMGDVPRLEMFARETTPGWDVWGNQVDGSIGIPAMEMFAK